MSVPPTDPTDYQTNRTSKDLAPIVIVARVLVWLMLLHGALMIAVGFGLLTDAIDFSSIQGGPRWLVRNFGFPMVFVGALNMVSAGFFFLLSTGRRLGVCLTVVPNVILCLVAGLGYLQYPYMRRELSSVVFWWYCFMAVNVLLGVVLRHPSVVSWCRAGRARRRPPTSGFPVITDER